MPEPTPFRPVEHYAPAGAKMIAAIERLENELAAARLELDAHRAALVTAGLLGADGTLPTPRRQPRVWRWENEADRVRPVFKVDTRTTDRYGDVRTWRKGAPDESDPILSRKAAWNITWATDLETRGPMAEVFDDDE